MMNGIFAVIIICSQQNQILNSGVNISPLQFDYNEWKKYAVSWCIFGEMGSPLNNNNQVKVQ